jgi:MFS family permease
MGAVVTTLGWRAAYVGAGAIVFVTVFLASRFLLRDPESVRLAVAGPTSGSFSEPASLRLGEAVRTRNFWLFAAGVIAAMSVALIPFVHLPALVTLDRGGGPAQGALAASLIGGGAIVGVLMARPLSDRMGRRATVLLVGTAEATAYLGWALGLGAVLLFSFIFGIFYGGIIVLMPAMAGDLFGRAHVGAVFGVVFVGIGWAGSLGVLGAGFGRDILGSYELVFQLAFLMCLVSMGLFLLLRVPQNKANQESGGGQR